MCSSDLSGSWSSFNVNSTSSASSCGSTSSTVNKVDLDTDCFDYEILWEDLTIGEQIGQGNFILSEQYVFVKYGSLQILPFKLMMVKHVTEWQECQ